ncbi:phage tail assembly chaperone [Cohnella thailandensis]|uniref:XkdN-like protein n=1 Tax=Cohnella thailandensis TaxID=557557 RepID=A0A841SPL8_9BACL|nr:XkdN-like protein [Cohnella thailandensis]MBB6632759.1 XkdN-like protein [Cohnella thailandensis]MBP1975552.1 hypothetical protein [Cohnella thailandensis]
MSTLQDFLNANPIDDVRDEVVISARFRDKDGNPMKFTIRAMTNREFEDVRRRSTEVKKGRKVEFDAQKFNTAVIINNTVVPDFKHADSIAKMGCRTPEEYLNKVLLAGEIAALAEHIQKLSGFDVDMESLVEEAKN